MSFAPPCYNVISKYAEYLHGFHRIERRILLNNVETFNSVNEIII